MGLFDWMSPKKKSKAAKDSAPVSSGLSRMESTKPVMKSHHARHVPPDSQPGKPANRKQERMARRELLYAIVRECMANAGVVSASYKFKVLSLDARGRQFLVMVDLSREYAGDTVRLAEIEAMVAQAAKSRYDIVVTAVYWRTNEHVAVGLTTPSRPAPLVTPSRPAPLTSEPVPLVSQPMPIQSRAAPRFEPLQDDEIAAFKSALANGTKPAVKAEPPAARSFDGTVKHGPQSYTLLTGFEDTELPDEEIRSRVLSATQYGDLR